MEFDDVGFNSFFGVGVDSGAHAAEDHFIGDGREEIGVSPYE
jgi:hypothetical protein